MLSTPTCPLGQGHAEDLGAPYMIQTHPSSEGSDQTTLDYTQSLDVIFH